jgi:hypothetical protein
VDCGVTGGKDSNVIAFVLAVVIASVAFIWSTRVAAGSDAYGYVSQADLWLRGNLFVDQSFAASVPWPMARWTFTPLGYRPEVDGYRIVPAYAPGLPLLMAAAKSVAGQCAVYAVVPLATGVLVFATYLIGYRLESPFVGLAAAVVVGTSPTVLFMAMAPMSDVPAAAVWAVAIALLLSDGVWSAAFAGVAAAVAILIRPNLAPLAVILGVWLAARRGYRAAGAFSIAAAAGGVAVAVVNAHLYGSPFRTGYDLTDAFAVANIGPNLRAYGWWLIVTETPLAIAGLVSLIWMRRWLLASIVAAVWTSYLIYVPWDAWWYLRFLLPSWPMMAVGTASCIALLRASRSPSLRALAPIALIGLASHGVFQAWQRNAFHEAAGESKYVEVARAVGSLTEPEAVIISAQHSGTLRYYAGRLTLRWDVGDPAWLDRTVDWLAAHGHHPYFVLEESEIEALRAKAGSVSAAARLDWTPMATFRGRSVQAFDAVNRVSAPPAVTNKPSFTVDACATNQLPASRW